MRSQNLSISEKNQLLYLVLAGCVEVHVDIVKLPFIKKDTELGNDGLL